MKEYLIFHYQIEGQDYVEAYPVQHDRASLMYDMYFSNRVQSYSFISAPSRNQARRAAYTNWIQADGVGFNQLPYRVYAEPAPRS